MVDVAHQLIWYLFPKWHLKNFYPKVNIKAFWTFFPEFFYCSYNQFERKGLDMEYIIIWRNNCLLGFPCGQKPETRNFRLTFGGYNTQI